MSLKRVESCRWLIKQQYIVCINVKNEAYVLRLRLAVQCNARLQVGDGITSTAVYRTACGEEGVLYVDDVHKKCDAV